MATVLSFFDMFSLKEIMAAHVPFALSPVPNPKANIQTRSLSQKLTGLRTVPNLGVLTTFLAADSDRAIVQRTWGLFSQIPSREDEFYGPNFTFSEHLKARNWLSGLLVHWGFLAAQILFVTLPPLRALVKKFVYQAGQGPEAEKASKDEIEYRALGTPDGGKEPEKAAFCLAWWRGSMYSRELRPLGSSYLA